jgi:hypothetical protein
MSHDPLDRPPPDSSRSAVDDRFRIAEGAVEKAPNIDRVSTCRLHAGRTPEGGILPEKRRAAWHNCGIALIPCADSFSKRGCSVKVDLQFACNSNIPRSGDKRDRKEARFSHVVRTSFRNPNELDRQPFEFLQS